MSSEISVLVLGGGPDGEREVSIRSTTAIAKGLREAGGFAVTHEIIDRLTASQLKAMRGDVIIPYLHGPYGEGGPLQDVLEQDGRPYLGSGPRPSRLAMDKIASKAHALELGIPTAPFAILNAADDRSPLPLPVVIKPVHEGSTLGLRICNSHAEYKLAIESIRKEQATDTTRVYLVEEKIGGLAGAHELTVGLLDNVALPVIHIRPKDGLYDYEAKYNRNDTQYIVDPQHLSDTVKKKICKATQRISKSLGLRHIARADFMLDQAGVAWFLEINTTPGFTDHSLVPKAAAHAGIPMPELCRKLVEMTLRDGRAKTAAGQEAAHQSGAESGHKDEPRAVAHTGATDTDDE